jgi:hypothetical protein
VRYENNGYPSDSPTFENGAGPTIAHGHKSSYSTGSTGSSTLSYDSSSSAPAIPYLHSHHQHPSQHQQHPPPHHHQHSASFSEGCYPMDQQPSQDDDSSYFTTDEGSSVGTTYGCACRANPPIAHALAGLSNPLQNAIAGLRQYAPHRDSTSGGGAGHDCRVYRKILQLHHLLQCLPPNPPSSSTAHSHVLALSFSGSGGGSDSGCESVGGVSNVSAAAAPSPTANGITNHAAAVSNNRHPGLAFEPLPRPTESEIIASLSASNSPYHGAPPTATSSGGHSPHEWNTLGVGAYGSYFPMQTAEHAAYTMS